MRLNWHHFVLGETIESALARAHSAVGRAIPSTCSAKRPHAADADRSFNSYPARSMLSAAARPATPLPDRPGTRQTLRAAIRVSNT